MDPVDLYALALCLPSAHTRVMTTELWQRLRQARRYADLTQSDLADKCGVSRGAVALWEAEEPEHRTKPTTDRLMAISTATGVPLEWLLNDASKLEDIWRIKGEFGDGGSPSAAPQLPASVTPDVLPDLLQEGHLFLFARTPEQIAAKLKQLHAAPEGVTPHLILINGGSKANVYTADGPASALSVVVQILSKS